MPRTIEAKVKVEVEDGDDRTPEEIGKYLDDALSVGLESHEGAEHFKTWDVTEPREQGGLREILIHLNVETRSNDHRDDVAARLLYHLGLDARHVRTGEPRQVGELSVVVALVDET